MSKTEGNLSELTRLDNSGPVIISLNLTMSLDPDSQLQLPAINSTNQHSFARAKEPYTHSLGELNCLLIAITVINEGKPAPTNTL